MTFRQKEQEPGATPHPHARPPACCPPGHPPCVGCVGESPWPAAARGPRHSVGLVGPVCLCPDSSHLRPAHAGSLGLPSTPAAPAHLRLGVCSRHLGPAFHPALSAATAAPSRDPAP